MSMMGELNSVINVFQEKKFIQALLNWGSFLKTYFVISEAKFVSYLCYVHY